MSHDDSFRSEISEGGDEGRIGDSSIEFDKSFTSTEEKELKDEIEKLREEVGILERKNLIAVGKYKEANISIMEYKSRYEGLLTCLNEKTLNTEELERQIQSLQKLNRGVIESLRNMDSKCKELNNENRELKHQVLDYKEQIRKSKSPNPAPEPVQQQQPQDSGIMEELKVLRKKVEELTKESENTIPEPAQQQPQDSNMVKEMKVLQQKVEELTKENQKKDYAIKREQMYISDLESQQRKLQEGLDEIIIRIKLPLNILSPLSPTRTSFEKYLKIEDKKNFGHIQLETNAYTPYYSWVGGFIAYVPFKIRLQTTKPSGSWKYLSEILRNDNDISEDMTKQEVKFFIKPRFVSSEMCLTINEINIEIPQYQDEHSSKEVKVVEEEEEEEEEGEGEGEGEERKKSRKVFSSPFSSQSSSSSSSLSSTSRRHDNTFRIRRDTEKEKMSFTSENREYREFLVCNLDIDKINLIVRVKLTVSNMF